MLIFGENINTINKKVAEALENKDSSFFTNLVDAQIESGVVDVIDINVGSFGGEETPNMEWLVPIVEKRVGGRAKISIDSSDPGTIVIGINKLDDKKGAIINSITLEESRHKDLIPLARELDLDIIGLPIDENGIPDNSEKRLKLAHKLVDLVENNGISRKKLLIDCIIEPVSVSTKNGLIALETVAKIKENIPDVKTFICLTAVSFSLPERKLLNRNFLSLLIKEGIDAVILNPLDRGLLSDLYATRALTDKDFYCQDYLNFMRGNKR
jgi:5-methyltetrahydrofolate--homocysteine methyltransferase